VTSAKTILAVLALSASALLGCFAHPEERAITYENGTRMILRVESDSSKLATLAPGETVVLRTRKNLLPDRIQAYDQDENLQFDQVVTWDELKAREFRFVITEDMLSPTPTDGR
jgi:hypothetical protein